MWTDHDAAVAAGYRVDAERWRVLFDDLMLTIGERFRRPEPRRRVRDFVRGLLAPLPTKNCWTIAEHAGDASPDGMQDLLTRVAWDDAEVRADVREFVGRELGDPEAVLVVDETGDLKKGRHTVGVQRQYSGTAGKIENCQLASTSSTPQRPPTRCSTPPSTYLDPGATIPNAAPRPASRTTCGSRPSHNWQPA